MPETPNGWPRQPDAAWPAGCLLEGVGAHPELPWLAAACTNAAEERGAVLVFDARAAAIRSTTGFESYVGWSQDRDLLRWHPDGLRLGTNTGTNGIALLDRARVVGHAFPDETRDTGVRYVWVDDRMFTDTGALFAIQPGDQRFDLAPVPGAPAFEEITWNAGIGAVVGRVGAGIAAFDPVGRRVVYHEPLDRLPNGELEWSPDGRWVARTQWAVPPAPDLVQLYDGDTGRLAGTVTPSAPRVDGVRWGTGGVLAILSHQHAPGRTWGQVVDLVRGGSVTGTFLLDPRKVTASHGVPEAAGMAWSPSGDGLALLLDGAEVQLRDGRDGRVVGSFVAPAAPVPAGLPDWYRPESRLPGDLLWLRGDHLVRLAPHFVSFWSVDGRREAEFVVPVR